MASPVSMYICVCVCLLLHVGTGFRLMAGHLGMDGGLWIKAISPKGQWLIYVSAKEVKRTRPHQRAGFTVDKQKEIDISLTSNHKKGR